MLTRDGTEEGDGLMDRIKGLWARFQRSYAWRAWTRFGEHRGNLLAGGVTYFSFLSLFPALALAFTVFGIALRGHPDWLQQIEDYISKALPGFVKNDANPDGLITLSIPSSTALTVTALVGFFGLLWAGLGWLSALRDGMRAIFDAEGSPDNFVVAKLRDFAVLVLFGLGIVLSAVLSAVAGGVASWVADHIGLGSQGWIVSVVGIVIGALLDACIVGLMIRMLSGVDLSWRAVRNGALFGGITLTILKLLGSRLIAGTVSNPVYGTIALTVGLLVWLNFIARALLLAAAWSADELEDSTVAAIPESVRAKALEGPEPAPALGAVPAGSFEATASARAVEGLPTFGQRAADRTTLAAGALVGVLGAVTVGATSRLVGRLVRGRR